MKLLRKKLNKAQCCGGRGRRMRPSCRHNHAPTAIISRRSHHHHSNHNHHYEESLHRTRRHGRPGHRTGGSKSASQQQPQQTGKKAKSFFNDQFEQQFLRGAPNAANTSAADSANKLENECEVNGESSISEMKKQYAGEMSQATGEQPKQGSEAMPANGSNEELIYPIKKFKAYHRYYNNKRKIIMEEEIRQKQVEKDGKQTGGESLANLASVAAVAMKMGEKDVTTSPPVVRKKKSRKPTAEGGELLNEESEVELEQEPGEVIPGAFSRMNGGGCETGDENDRGIFPVTFL